MNSEYELEKLVSNCSVANSEISSIPEAETTFVTPKARSDDQLIVTVGTKNGNHQAYHDERPNCLKNMKDFNKEKQYNYPLQNQKETTEGLISEEENPSDEQMYVALEEMKESITVGQDNIHDGQDFLPTDMNIVNLEESLQSSLIETFPQTQGKTSLKVSVDNANERIATSKEDWQNAGERDNQHWIIKTLFTLQPFLLTKVLCSKDTETLNATRVPIREDFLSFAEQKRLRQIYYRFHQNEVKIRELQTIVNKLCSLLDKNFRFFCSVIVPHLKKEAKVNKTAEQLIPKQVVTITNSFIDGTSHTSSIKRTLKYEGLSQIRCYDCNKTSHLAKFCHNRKKI